MGLLDLFGKRRPKTADEWLQQGIQLADKRKHEDAIHCYDEGLKLGDNSGLFGVKGHSLAERKRWTESLACFENASRLAPEVPVFWLGKARVQEPLGRHDEAVGSFRQFIGLISTLPAQQQLGFLSHARELLPVMPLEVLQPLDPNVRQMCCNTIAEAAGNASAPAQAQRVTEKVSPEGREEFRALLFADQSLSALVEGVNREGLPSAEAAPGNPWSLFVAANELARDGRREEAKQLLHRAADLPNTEARIHLWAWRALRDLSEAPDAQTARQVLGVVIEKPQELGLDTLAAYADGSVRYINQGGSIIVWDQVDDTINLFAKNVVLTAAPLVDRVPPPLGAQRGAVPGGCTRFTLLTCGGNRVTDKPDNAEGPFSPVFGAGARLLLALFEKTGKGK